MIKFISSKRLGLFSCICLSVFLLAFLPRIISLANAPTHIDERIYSIYTGSLYTRLFFTADFSNPSWWLIPEEQIPDSAPPLVRYFIGFFQNLGGIKEVTTNSLENPSSNILFFSRLPIVLTGAGTCLLIYLFSKKKWSWKWSLIPAIFLAFDPLFLYYSRLALLEVPMMFFFTASILFFYEAFRDFNTNRLYISAILFGLALSSKLIGIFTFLVLLTWLVYLIYKRSARNGSNRWIVRFPTIPRKFFLATILFTPISFFIMFVLWPYLWPNPLGRFAKIWVKYGFTVNPIWNPEFDPQNHLFYLNVILKNFTIPEVAFFAIGIAYLLYKLSKRKLNKWDSLVLIWFLIPFIQLNVMHYKLWRYTLLIIPQITLISALGLSKMVEKVSKTFPNRRWLPLYL